MNPLDEANRQLLAFEETLRELDRGPITAEGIVGTYAATLIPRLRSTYSAMSILLGVGYHDEAVLLLRRQLEDSMRLHYLVSHRERADRLVLGHQRGREQKVLKQLDRAIGKTSVNDLERAALKRMASIRRRRIKNLDDMAYSLGVVPESLPSFHIMALELGRSKDLVPYASASEVTHSALSGATDGYVAASENGSRPVQLVGLTSENPHDRLGYARAAINTTGMALLHGLLLLEMDAEARSIGRDAATRVENLQSLQSGLTNETSGLDRSPGD